MKILSNIQNNLSGSFYNDHKDQNMMIRQDEELDFMSDARAVSKKETSEKILSNTEKNTLHMFFGTKVPDDMKLYGQNNIKQIHKGQLLDLRG